MARKPTLKAAAPVDQLDGELMDKDLGKMDTRNAELAVINADYGDNLPYDITRLENETKFYLAQSADAMLQAGNRLILIKEHEGAGNFISSLDRIGLDRRSATNFMRAAVKFSGTNGKTFSHLGKSKLFALMTEADEDLDVLAEGGTLAGKTLDSIDQMSVREFKQALRAAKQEKEASEKIIADKDKKINELDRDAQRKQLLAGDELHAELEKDLHTSLGHTLGELRVLGAAIGKIKENDRLPDHLHGICWQGIERIRSMLRDIELDYNVIAIESDADDFDEDGQLAWGKDLLKEEHKSGGDS